MHSLGKFPCQDLIYHSVGFDPALPAKNIGSNLDAKMALTPLTSTGVPLMEMRFVNDLKRYRMKSLG